MAWVVITNWGITLTDSIEERDSVAREEMKAHHEPYVLELKSWQEQITEEEWRRETSGPIVTTGRGGPPELYDRVAARVKSRIEGLIE